MATNIPGIYAVGDVLSPLFSCPRPFTRDSPLPKIRGKRPRGKTVPICIFTNPPMARAGLTEEEALAAGYTIKTGKFPFSANGKAFLQDDGEGLIKIVADREKGIILGMHILGPHASDLIMEGALAVEAGARVADLGRLIHPHPTLSETTWEAALSVFDFPLHMAGRRNP